MRRGALAVIPGPLVVPAHAGRERHVPLLATVVRCAAVVLLVAALAGALAWISQLSPLHFARWQSLDTLHNLTIDEPGRYVLFEEGDGVAGRVGPPAVAVSVRSTAGRVVPVRSEIDDGGFSTTTYQVPFVQGRALATFDIDRAGKYIVLTYPVGVSAPDDPTSRPALPDFSGMPSLALARAGEPSPLGSLAGLGVVAGIPALMGAALLAVAAIIWPSPIKRTRDRSARRADRSRRRSDRRDP